MFKNWFKKSDVDVPDLEKIEVSPKIEIPDKTRRELYEGAVLEVTKARVRELIRREIYKMGSSPLTQSQSRALIKDKGLDIPESLVPYVREKYPAVHLERSIEDPTEFRVVQCPNIHTLVDTLTEIYMKEFLKNE